MRIDVADAKDHLAELVRCAEAGDGDGLSAARGRDSLYGIDGRPA